MPKRRQLRGFDLKQLEGFASLIGVDEAGRGALAGPVCAGAVLVTREFLECRWVEANARRINDSKQINAVERAALYLEFERLVERGLIHAHYGFADVAEIEQFNILGATKLAMRRALEGIYPPTAFQKQQEPDLFASAAELEAYHPQVSARILVDGLALRNFPYPHLAVVNGDARSLCVAMASIIAKVARDRVMEELEALHPGYGFGQHKGYATEDHRAALLRLGRCHQHRDTFLRKLLSGRMDASQLDLFA